PRFHGQALFHRGRDDRRGPDPPRLGREDIIANRAASPPGPSPSPGGEAVRIRDIQFPATSEAGKSDSVTGHSGKTARDWIASTSEPTNQRPTGVHRWFFEVDGGNGPIQWTRRRVEGTRPREKNGPRRRPETAGVSERVTQSRKRSSGYYY
ncbi:hypothetical protein THAOC_10751, partial [Thalassiosira oceanica]